MYGIWEGKDRIVFFEESSAGTSEIVIILKDFYGWYYDRVVEPLEKSETYPRSRNDATPRTAEQIGISVNSISKSKIDNAYELNLNYSKGQNNKIPVYISDDNMFINFYIQDENDLNFYRGNTKTAGIKVSEHSNWDNLSCLYFTESSFFDIRYWLTDMEYEDSKVSVVYDGYSFEVDKHIFSSDCNYSCVSGRSRKVRNVVAPLSYDENTFKFSSDKSVIIMDNEPYLTKIADKNTFEDLMEIVKAANSRRKPYPPPLFPPS
ncbi:MAG: hypothetical protein MJ184_12735, partial [Treponema sp.]|uniref:hypothetical protein n=1 Tax=Treponema sp. TaxID=166 RepID=UPI00298DDF0E